MSYKQKSNPFNGPASFRNPKNVGTSNFNALEFEMPDLSQIANKTADGDSKTVDITNESKTGSSNEGEQKDKVPKTQNEITVEKAREANKSNELPTLKELRQDKRTEAKAQSTALKEANKRIKASTFTDKQQDRINRREARRLDRQADKLIKFREQGRISEDDRTGEKIKQQLKGNIQMPTRGAQLFSPADDSSPRSGLTLPQSEYGGTELPEFEFVATNNNAPKMKQVNRKGGGFPMVNQPQKTDERGNPLPEPNPKGSMAMGGRPLNSNILMNDPNNNLDPSKVSAQQEDKAQQFASIASSAGTPTPQYDPYKTQMQGMAFNAKLEKASELGQLNDNPEFKRKVDEAIKKQKQRATQRESEEQKGMSMINLPGTSMKSMNHAHTRVTKGNLKATERDDAAHMDYLKRDINYDAKHGGSKKQMLDDEKHISKLAGDLKYDSEHRGRKYDNV